MCNVCGCGETDHLRRHGDQVHTHPHAPAEPHSQGDQRSGRCGLFRADNPSSQSGCEGDPGLDDTRRQSRGIVRLAPAEACTAVVSTQVILTVGNGMMGDDAAGPLLAALLQRSPAPGWQVVDGGSAPENVVHRVRAVAPERVLVIDAAEMELEPGEVRLIDDRLVIEQFIATTHDLPVSFLIAALRQSVPEVHFLGIQPSLIAFGYPLTEPVQRAVLDIHARLRQGASVDSWSRLKRMGRAN